MPKKKVFAVGIDVSAEKVHVAIEGRDEILEFANSEVGHSALIKVLTKKGRRVRVVLEATSNYHLDLAISLSEHERCEVMVANPRITHAFHQARGRRAKTDKVDAVSLREHAATMAFVPWTPPPESVVTLRRLARYYRQLTVDETSLKNQLGAYRSTRTTPDFIIEQLEERIRGVEANLKTTEAQMQAVCKADPAITEVVDRLDTIPGIGEATAMQFAAQFLTLDETMTSKQITAWAGLDPRPKESGTSVRGRRAISKRGSATARGVLYMPALTAIRVEGPMRDLYHRICGTKAQRTKPSMVGLVAVMRKMLVVAWTMHRSKTPWCAEKASPSCRKEAA